MHSKWFNFVRNEFSSRLMPYAGRPLTYVEIGVWHGACATWVCENILTHPDSRGIGIDPYAAVGRHPAEDMERIKQEAINNLLPYVKWKWIFEDSKTALRSWDAPIDILYIDGLHESIMAMQDFVLAFPFLSKGSLVIFDDFLKGQNKPLPCVPEVVAAILLAFEGVLEPCVNNDKQFAAVVKHDDLHEWRASMRDGTHNPTYAMNIIQELMLQANRKELDPNSRVARAAAKRRARARRERQYKTEPEKLSPLQRRIGRRARRLRRRIARKELNENVE